MKSEHKNEPKWMYLQKDEYVKHTFKKLRRAIGYLGVGLPVSLLVLHYFSFFKTDFQPSISHFYYTNFREIFTGILCAVGLFMVMYEGHKNAKWWKNDTLLTNIAGAMAFGVAFFPTNPLQPSDKVDTLIDYPWEWLGGLHYAFAGALFLAFALLSYFSFTIGQAENDLKRHWLNENNLYKTGGILIILFVLAVPIAPMLTDWPYTTFLFELLALAVFGFVWLIKGRAFGDKGSWGRMVYHESN